MSWSSVMRIIKLSGIAYLIYALPIGLLAWSYYYQWWGLSPMFDWVGNLPVYSNEEQAIYLFPGGIVDAIGIPIYALCKAIKLIYYR